MTSVPPIPATAFAGTITRAGFVRVQSLLLPAWARWYVMYPVLGAIFLAASLPGATPIDVVSDLLFMLLFAAAMTLFTRRVRHRAWQQAVRLNGRVHGALTAEGLEWNTDNTASRFEWAKIVKVAHAPDMTLAFHTPRCAFYFPRSFFETEAAWSAFNAEIDARVPARR
jgi:hypothetical protein